LYQAGFISYPRTETDSFSSRTDLHVGNLVFLVWTPIT
jgi:DNA topoisomerase IA